MDALTQQLLRHTETLDQSSRQFLPALLIGCEVSTGRRQKVLCWAGGDAKLAHQGGYGCSWRPFQQPPKAGVMPEGIVCSKTHKQLIQYVVVQPLQQESLGVQTIDGLQQGRQQQLLWWYGRTTSRCMPHGLVIVSDRVLGANPLLDGDIGDREIVSSRWPLTLS